MTFNTWIDTFLSEKEIDLDESFTVNSPNGTPNHMTLQNVVDVMKNNCQIDEQNAIKNMMVKLDFKNMNISDYIKHLGQAIAIDL